MSGTIDTEPTDRANRAAENVREALSDGRNGWEVTARRTPGGRERDVITAYMADYDDVGVNSYTKASVINIVLTEVPSLVVDSTEDGNMAVSFKFKND